MHWSWWFYGSFDLLLLRQWYFMNFHRASGDDIFNWHWHSCLDEEFFILWYSCSFMVHFIIFNQSRNQSEELRRGNIVIGRILLLIGHWTVWTTILITKLPLRWSDGSEHENLLEFHFVRSVPDDPFGKSICWRRKRGEQMVTLKVDRLDRFKVHEGKILWKTEWKKYVFAGRPHCREDVVNYTYNSES